MKYQRSSNRPIWYKRHQSAFIQDSQFCPRLLQNLWGGNEFYPWPCSFFIAFTAYLCVGGAVQTGPQPHQVPALSVQRGHRGWGPPLQGPPPPAGQAHKCLNRPSPECSRWMMWSPDQEVLRPVEKEVELQRGPVGNAHSPCQAIH